MSVGDIFANSYYNSVMKGQELVSLLESPSINNILQDIVLPYMIPILFFAALSPGFLISIPPTSKKHCADVAPLPGDVGDGTCANGYFVPGSSPYSPTILNNVCAAQQKCHQFGRSGTVTVWSALVHGFVYVLGFNIILYLVSSFVNRAAYR